ncbi:MAG TPA: DNA gyrase inhibitor YacG [Pyrinomonadaceae bacterium]|jgi:endogenous inhibitor of DNA gyrase (YacG/DUF329 family)|nr:DNA gyrase inhibitor YacG [Pyrinomonadaceae bacterium]
MKQIKCPQCGKLTTWENNPDRPFCSERCRMLDFGAWIDEEYRVPDPNSPVPPDQREGAEEYEL